MKKIIWITTSAFFIVTTYGQPGKYSQVSTPKLSKVIPFKYQELPLGSIKPAGWLQHQLNIMRDGTTGHLDEVHNKIKNDNGWLGGQGDSWEETPYWLDGAVPLAYTLNDSQLKQKVLKYINWTLENQRPSGYFGPITTWERTSGKKITIANADMGEDWWPKMIMLKVMQQYYSATGDKRVIIFMSKFFNYQLQALKIAPVGKWSEWATSRGADNILIAQWLYGITQEKSLVTLCDKLQAQSFKWSDLFKSRDWVINAAAYQNDSNWMSRHGVNVGMGLKDPIVEYQRTGNKEYLQSLKTGFHDLMTLHGMPYGMFSADEDLHGNDPTQGTELCAIVESMFSLEQAIAMTGDNSYADALERMTFNALPTQTTIDYNNKQYFQVANQVQISRGVFNFSLPFDRQMNNVLGMRSGYTCCLANMHQGWTKFTSHLWFSTPDKGLVAMLYSPNKVITAVGKQASQITIEELTNYPFEDSVRFKMSLDKDVVFPLRLRIPSWCKEATIILNGTLVQKKAGGKTFIINRNWKNSDMLTLVLPMTVMQSTWGRNSRAIERGPLVYALKLNERWEKGNQDVEGDYFSVYPKDDWNYGLPSSILNNLFTETKVNNLNNAGEDFVWNVEHAPIEIITTAKKIPAWKINADGVAPQPVTDRTGIYKGIVDTAIKQISLIPYGCTKVRIVAFPVVE